VPGSGTVLGRHQAASLAAIDNDGDDNGIWTVDAADILGPLPNVNQPELKIQIKLQGTSGIVFRRVSYTAFFLASPIT
jgi:hypothetical protein